MGRNQGQLDRSKNYNVCAFFSFLWYFATTAASDMEIPTQNTSQCRLSSTSNSSPSHYKKTKGKKTTSIYFYSRTRHGGKKYRQRLSWFIWSVLHPVNQNEQQLTASPRPLTFTVRNNRREHAVAVVTLPRQEYAVCTYD